MVKEVSKSIYLILLKAKAGMTYHDIFDKLESNSLADMNDALRYLLDKGVIAYTQGDGFHFGTYRLNQ